MLIKRRLLFSILAFLVFGSQITTARASIITLDTFPELGDGIYRDVFGVVFSICIWFLEAGITA